jgi:hypothetical protein
VGDIEQFNPLEWLDKSVRQKVHLVVGSHRVKASQLQET